MGSCMSYGPNYVDQQSIAWPDDEEKGQIKEDENVLKAMSWNS